MAAINGNELAGVEDENDDSRRTIASRDARLGEDVVEAPSHLSAEAIRLGLLRMAASGGGLEARVSVCVLGCGKTESEADRGKSGHEEREESEGKLRGPSPPSGSRGGRHGRAGAAQQGARPREQKEEDDRGGLPPNPLEVLFSFILVLFSFIFPFLFV